MAIGMKEYEIVCPVCTPFTSPDHVMTVPSSDFGDCVIAHRTEPFLFLPKMQKSSFTGQVLLCFYIETFFKVGFPGRVERVCCPLDSCMSLDFHISCSP